MEKRKGLNKLFPDTEIQTISGMVEESGTTPIAGVSDRPVRWIKVNGKVFTGLDDGLYHTPYEQKVDIAYDGDMKVVAYWNQTTQSGSNVSNSSVIGAIALVLIFTAIAYYGGIWNFIWKGISEWWLTIGIIFIFSLYAVVWTPVFVYKEMKRQRVGHELLSKLRG